MPSSTNSIQLSVFAVGWSIKVSSDAFPKPNFFWIAANECAISLLYIHTRCICSVQRSAAVAICTRKRNTLSPVAVADLRSFLANTTTEIPH